MVLKVTSKHSLLWPQVEPEMALSSWRREVADATIWEMWGEKVKWVLGVMPKILGVLQRGIGELLM